MRVIIAGSRKFDNKDFLYEMMDQLLADYTHDEVEIISGGASGADMLGIQYANDRDYALRVFLADWGKHGKSAGPIRNSEMIKIAEAAVFFWDGKSPGTADCIRKAKNKGILAIVFQ